VLELQRRREQQQQQQPLRGSAQAAPAKVDESTRQAELMRSLLLRSGGDDSDGDDGVQPYASTFGNRQQHLASERSILDPVPRSTYRASGTGSKSGSGALISDSDSESVEGARVPAVHLRQAGAPSSPVAKASLSLAASMRTAAGGAQAAVDETSSSGESDEGGESDYEEDFDAESGSGSSRQPPVRVRRAPSSRTFLCDTCAFPLSPRHTVFRCRSCSRNPPLLPTPRSVQPPPNHR
jgi:hypothetical protein